MHLVARFLLPSACMTILAEAQILSPAPSLSPSIAPSVSFKPSYSLTKGKKGLKTKAPDINKKEDAKKTAGEEYTTLPAGESAIPADLESENAEAIIYYQVVETTYEVGPALYYIPGVGEFESHGGEQHSIVAAEDLVLDAGDSGQPLIYSSEEQNGAYPQASSVAVELENVEQPVGNEEGESFSSERAETPLSITSEVQYEEAVTLDYMEGHQITLDPAPEVVYSEEFLPSTVVTNGPEEGYTSTTTATVQSAPTKGGAPKAKGGAKKKTKKNSVIRRLRG